MVNDQPIILLFTADPSLAPLGDALQGQGLAAVDVSTIEEARRLLASYRDRSIAVLDTSRLASYPIDAVCDLLHQSPPVPTLLLYHEGAEAPISWDYLGALDDYSVLPLTIDQLVLRVQVLLRRTRLARPSLAAQATSRPRSLAIPRQTVAVFGSKGGVGRSTIAVNLAVGLAQLYGQRVALLDADLWFGDVAVLLDLPREPSIADLVDFGEHLDPEVLRRVLHPHPSEVRVLCAPPHPARVETIPAALPARVARICRKAFDVVVVDTGASLDEHVVEVLDVADRILLVTTPELGALRSSLEVVNLAPTLGWREKLRLVVNRANVGVAVSQVEQMLGLPVTASIVSAEAQAVAAANLGKPMLLLDPTGTARVTRDLGGLVAQLVGEPEPDWGSPPAAWRQVLQRLGMSGQAASPASRALVTGARPPAES
jgi:pilus assembly protein CpaE